VGHEIRYRDRCARLVSPGDLAGGKAVATEDGALCAACVGLLGAGGPEAPGAPAQRDSTPAADPGGRLPVPRAKAPEKAKRPVRMSEVGLGLGVFAAAAVVTVAVVLLSGSHGGPPVPESVPESAAPTPGPREPAPRIPKVPEAATRGRLDAPVPPATPKAERRVGGDSPAADPPDGGRERALEALASARELAAGLAAKDDFDGALELLEGLPPGTARLVPAELKTAADALITSARERVGAIEAEVLEQVAAGQPGRARALLAEAARLKAARALPEVGGIVKGLEAKIAAAEGQATELAARRARDAVAAALAEFDGLLAAGDYDAARERATVAARGLDKETRQVLLAAAELAGVFPERERVLRRKYADLAGKRVDIGTRTSPRRGVTVKQVSDEGLTIEWTYRIGNEERSRTATLPWPELSAEEIESRLADWRADDPGRPMAEAVMALGAKNVDEAERLLGRAREHPLRDWLARKIEVARRGAAEVAAEEAWRKILRGVPAEGRKTSEEVAERKLAEIAAFEAEHGRMDAAAGRAGEIADVRARLREIMSVPVTIQWLVADNLDLYHNDKPLREYEPDFRKRKGEAYNESPFTAKIMLRSGDVFTAGGKRGGYWGGTVVVTGEDGALVWYSNTVDWRAYIPADPEQWHLPEVAMRSEQAPVEVGHSFGHQKQMRSDHDGKPLPIWGDKSERFVYMVGVYKRAAPKAGPGARAARIAWEAPREIRSVDILRQAGRLVHAGSWGASATVRLGGETIRFEERPFGKRASDGRATCDGAAILKGAFSAPARFDAGFASVLDGKAFRGHGATGPVGIVISGLRAGSRYQIQLLDSDSRGGNAALTQAWSDHPTRGSGSESARFAHGNGVSVIGRFTAKGTTQRIWAHGSGRTDSHGISGYVLREL
jgi:hypothetical protein